ncbi:MAG: Gfo/Idh/MocA family oxidoreductase [Cytophagaceae bacterium]|nr:Gfo/Idh/MocA family oxidoreductase [Cytophagaceae bacterium]
MNQSDQSRRDFVKTTSLLTGGLLAAPLFGRSQGFQSGVADTIKVALIGCGGRGTGAAVQALSTKQNVQLVAMADAFSDRLESSVKEITEALQQSGNASRFNVGDAKFVGFDGYQKAIALADVVILATPPGFRPIHFEEAVKQNKHVFMEKPVATDPAGIQKVLAVAEEAKKKKLNVVTGLQRHYQNSYRALYKNKALMGDIVSGNVYWNNDGVWVRPRQKGQTEMEYQMRNWYYFNWLCGDHINEQHVHNIDVFNWFKGGYPVRAKGTGGREVRNGKEFGEIFDHHHVEYEYADGTILNSECRHIKGTWAKVDEILIGTKGKMLAGDAKIVDYKGKPLFVFDKKTENNAYQTEHDELFAAIAKGEYKFWDAERTAKSTMTAILGRLATYSGQVIEWDTALNSGMSLMPKEFSFDATPPITPDKDGMYPVAVPGVTRYFA